MQEYAAWKRQTHSRAPARRLLAVQRAGGRRGFQRLDRHGRLLQFLPRRRSRPADPRPPPRRGRLRHARTGARHIISETLWRTRFARRPARDRPRGARQQPARDDRRRRSRPHLRRGPARPPSGCRTPPRPTSTPAAMSFSRRSSFGSRWPAVSLRAPRARRPRPSSTSSPGSRTPSIPAAAPPSSRPTAPGCRSCT